MSELSAEESLKLIKPGINYPSKVTVEEVVDGKTMLVKFLLQSYAVGMYCAIYVNSEHPPAQIGDHNNKKVVTSLKKDLAAAIKRKAKVTIGTLQPVKTL